MVDAIIGSTKVPTKALRRRSRSEGSSKAAEELHASLLPSGPSSTNKSLSRLAELYVPTSQGMVFQDEKFQRAMAAKAELLIVTAVSSESSKRNALIAKKALKYRQMRSRQATCALRSSALA